MARPKSLAHGVLEGAGVTVADVAQANRLHNKSLAGTPQPGNALRLTSVEAAYCAAAGWLEVRPAGGADGSAPMPWSDLLAHADDPRRAHVAYLVYRDLRERGLAARPAPGEGRFDVWPRAVPHATQATPAFRVVACADADPVQGNDLLRHATDGLVAAVVDADGAVTHYTMARSHPTGAAPAGGWPLAQGRALADRVLVTDPAACAVYAQGFLGTPHGDGRLLSRLEAEALRREDALHVAGALGGDAPGAQVATFIALRRAGVVAKSGFRFGTHLRGYEGDPDQGHATWLVHCSGPDDELGWSVLSRGVRLAHGVRKEFLVAVTGGGPSAEVAFVRLAWFRP